MNLLHSLFLILVLFFGVVPVSTSQQDYYETGFYLEFEDVQDPYVADILENIPELGELLWTYVGAINDWIEIPELIPIYFQSCQDINECGAWFDPNDRYIVMCETQLISYFEGLQDAGFEGDELYKGVINQVFSTLYHEMGHALVEILHLPITGREEDAVEQFSMLSLMSLDQFGIEAVMQAAIFAGINAESNMDEIVMSDEHSLNGQAYYDLLCLIYGSDPDSYEFLVDQGYLPEERSINCPDDFEKIQYAWSVMLEPYLRN